MPLPVRFSKSPFARWACLAAAAGFLTALAGCSDSPLRSLAKPWFEDVGGSSSSDVFATSSQGIWHYNGRSWLLQLGETDGFLNGVWAPARNNVYVVWSSGDGGLTGKVRHFDGHVWTKVAFAPAALQSVWGSSASDVFAVGRQGTILHYDGSSWSTATTGRGEWLEGIWGSSSHDVFVGGGQDSILHYDGVSWARQYTGAPSLAVWGSSSHDVFAVGGHYITHYDGTSWSPQASGTTNNLFGVWGSSPTDVFAVGTNGTILHYDGTSWSPQASGTTEHLYSVWGSSQSDVFAVGANGALQHYDGVQWRSPASVTNAAVRGPAPLSRLTAPTPAAP